VPDILRIDPPTADVRLLLAHGAGAGMTSPFLEAIANLLAARAIATARFEFAYMAERRATGKRRPPPRAERLVDEYVAALDAAYPGERPLIGGKSMGGRVASLVADQLYREGRIAGLVCLGYPFHPPKAPEKLRTAHLAGLACPTLVIQGERDPFGTRSEVAGYPLSPAIRLHWLQDADHDLVRRGARADCWRDAADAIAAFARTLD